MNPERMQTPLCYFMFCLGLLICIGCYGDKDNSNGQSQGKTQLLSVNAHSTWTAESGNQVKPYVENAIVQEKIDKTSRQVDSTEDDAEIFKLGAKVFVKGMCHKCHGKNGKGTRLGPDLTDKKWSHVDGSKKSIEKLLKTGVPKSKLSDKKYRFAMNPATNLIKDKKDLAALATYVQSLSKE